MSVTEPDPPPAPPWPDQGGNVVIINGGVSEERLKTEGDFPAIFPDFSVDTPANIVLGGWAGPPPGPPAGTGLVTGGGGGNGGNGGNGGEAIEPVAQSGRAPAERRRRRRDE